ncbi:MAG: hypothetical protein Q6363_008350 [Candidatus Njordarchaeota archaeon]
MAKYWVVNTECEKFPKKINLERADEILGTYLTLNKEMIEELLNSKITKKFECKKEVISPAELVMNSEEFILIFAKDINDLDFYILLSCIEGDYVLSALGPEPLCDAIRSNIRMIEVIFYALAYNKDNWKFIYAV